MVSGRQCWTMLDTPHRNFRCTPEKPFISPEIKDALQVLFYWKTHRQNFSRFVQINTFS